MTVSGSSSFNPVVLDIIAQALRQLGVIDENETPDAAMYSTGLFQLNAIVTAAQATGLHVWTEEEAVLFIEPEQVRYEIGGPGTNANTSDADDWIELTLQSSAAAGATSISVNTIVGVASGNNIGVILENGVTFWTTVNGAPSGSTVHLSAALPAIASSGSFALVYSTPISRPLKVPAARLLYLQGLNETPMTIMSRQEYMDTPNKLSPGTPTQWFYSPQRDRGLFYIWPAPVVSGWAIRFTWYRPLQDFFSPTDTMDFPQEWVSPLMWSLCRDLMGIYDTPPARQAYIENQAAAYAELVVNYDRESEPIQFGMDWQAVNNA